MVYRKQRCPFSSIFPVVAITNHKYIIINTSDCLCAAFYSSKFQPTNKNNTENLFCSSLSKEACSSTIKQKSLDNLLSVNKDSHCMKDSFFDETTDDFGAGDETCDSTASVSASTVSTIKKSIDNRRRNTHKKNKELLTSTSKSEAKWIELELEKYPRTSTVLDEEDSLDNRDTDKVVSMKPNKSSLSNSLQPDMAGTGAGALSKEHILVLTGKVVAINTLANIIMSPEQAEKTIKAKNKMLKARDSQMDTCVCKGNCGAHLSLPKERYLEYMMSTDELGEVVFTPYVGVGVTCKHIQMPPTKIFVVGSKADGNNGKKHKKTEKSKSVITPKRSENYERSRSHMNPEYVLDRTGTSQTPSHVKIDFQRSTHTPQSKGCNEKRDVLPISRMDKITPIALPVLTASNFNCDGLSISASSSSLTSVCTKNSEWSDQKENKVHKHSTTKKNNSNNSIEIKQLESKSNKRSTLTPNKSLDKRNNQSSVRTVECESETSISTAVSDWDDISI